MCNMSGYRSKNALRPTRLQRHLRAKQPGLQNKNLEFFEAKKKFNRMKILSCDALRKFSFDQAVEASFEIAYLISLAKKPHYVGQALIKTCMPKAASLVLGKANRKELAKISLTASTVKTSIDEIAEDIALSNRKNKQIMCFCHSM